MVKDEHNQNLEIQMLAEWELKHVLGGFIELSYLHTYSSQNKPDLESVF